jgi:integrase
MLGEIKNNIERCTFDYAGYFPSSKRLKSLGISPNSNKTVGEYLDDYQQSAIRRGLSPSTVEGYRKLKLSLSELHNIPIKLLTPSRLKQFVQASTNTTKTLRNKLSYLRSALAESVTDGVLQINPVDGIKLSNYTEKDNKVDLKNEHKDIKPFSPNEIQAIYDHSEGMDCNIIKLAFNTGMRNSEWSSLKWENVDFDRKVIHVKTAIVHGIEKTTKSRSGLRTIPLNEDALSALREQMALTYVGRHYVFSKNNRAPVRFPSGELNRVNPDSFRKHRWTKILASAKVDYRYPYQMRHTFATMHISQGVNLWKIANWMGHASPEMIFNHYGRYIEEHEHKEDENHALITQIRK